MGTAAAGERIEAYDLARAFAIFFVFLGHIIITQTTSFPLQVVFGTLSPGLTMSLLGFISAALLSTRTNDAGLFLVSYEFYILHFYFIGRGFDELFGGPMRMALEIPISFALVLAIATGLYFVDSPLRRHLDAYLLESRSSGDGLSAR